MAQLISRRRKELGLALGSALGILLLADFALGRAIGPVYRLALGDKRGWSPPARAKRRVLVQDTKGHYRLVLNEYSAYGFKRWPSRAADRERVLIIGDSVTQADHVSNGEEWYALLERALPNVAFFVFGGGGYGSLQEFMVLDEFVDRIRPGVIVWQFCSNDYSNNLYELDKRGYPHNNHAVRPYLEGEKVAYRLPLPFSKLRSISFVADRILARYDRWELARFVRRGGLTADGRREARVRFDRDPENNRLVEQSVLVTQRILRLANRRAGGMPFLLFNACGPLTAREERVCASAGVTCVGGVYEQIVDGESRGLELRVHNDGHWNKEGNRLAGEKLLDLLEARIRMVPKGAAAIRREGEGLPSGQG